MMPSCDQIGVPIHFHSSTTPGSASLMSLRILLRVSRRQSPSSAILCEISSVADWLSLTADFFMLSSWSLHTFFDLVVQQYNGRVSLQYRTTCRDPCRHYTNQPGSS